MTPTPRPSPTADLDELRRYAERASQQAGAATVIVALGGTMHEYVTEPATLARYSDQVIGALADALRQRHDLNQETPSE